jgi:hypothetical protein
MDWDLLVMVLWQQVGLVVGGEVQVEGTDWKDWKLKYVVLNLEPEKVPPSVLGDRAVGVKIPPSVPEQGPVDVVLEVQPVSFSFHQI